MMGDASYIYIYPQFITWYNPLNQPINVDIYGLTFLQGHGFGAQGEGSR